MMKVSFRYATNKILVLGTWGKNYGFQHKEEG